MKRTLATYICLLTFYLSPAGVFAGELEERLFKEVGSGNVPAVKALLENGVDVNAKSTHRLINGTALMWASMLGNADVSKVLLDGGADVNASNGYGETALMRAAWNGNAAVVRVLLEKGADVNAKHRSGSTALIQASDRGHNDVVRLLVEKGADVNAKDEDGMTALRAANEIIEKGQWGPVREDGKMRREPLSPADRANYEEIVRILKMAGAR